MDERARDFVDVAGEVREWDRVLRENGEQISKLYNAVLPLSPLQTTITSSLDYIESQQADLSSILDSYESQISDLVDLSAMSSSGLGRSVGGAGAGGGSAAEKERERAYQLATDLSQSLDSTSTSLSSLIQTLNALSPTSSAANAIASAAAHGSDDASALTGAGAGGAADPLAQIAAILNAHLGSLRWIEGTTDALRTNVRDLEGRVADVHGRMVGTQGRVGGSSSSSSTPLRNGAGQQQQPLGASLGAQGRASPFARRA